MKSQRRYGVSRVVRLCGPESGGVLVLALIAVVTVSFIAASFLQLSSAVTRSQVQSIERKKAFYLAEAGLSEAYAGMCVGKTGEVGSQENPALFGDGLLWVEAQDLDETHVQLDCTAMVGSSKALLSLVVERGELGMAYLGLFSDGDLVIPAGTSVDSYDSSLGDYESQEKLGGTKEPEPARVGANGDILLSGLKLLPASVDGDVTPGPGKSVSYVGTTLVTGSDAARSEAVTLPDVVTPGIPLLAEIIHESGSTLLLGTGDQGFQSIQVSDASELVLQGPCRLLVSDLIVEGGSTLAFDTTNGEIEVFVQDELDLAQSSEISFTEESTELVSIQVAGTTTVIASSTGSFFGFLYAPLASVQIGSGFTVFGSVVAGSLSLAPGSEIHFDSHLAALAEWAWIPAQTSWRLVDLGVVAADSMYGNPFELLSFDPALLEPLAQAHQDVWIDIEYIQIGGAKLTYSGMESAFDWTQVQRVNGLIRASEEVVFKDGITPKAVSIN